MPNATQTLIWLFPIAFMLHDFEELIFGEAWLRRHGGEIAARLRPRLPAFMFAQIDAVLHKSTAELALPIGLIFTLTVIATLLAAVFHVYSFFIMASGLFCLHGFMHVGQALLLRRYVPAVITSALIAIPYGLALFPRLIAAGVVAPAALPGYAVAAIVLMLPFILAMHRLGEWLYRLLATRLV